jgi:hypothetical protein
METESATRHSKRAPDRILIEELCLLSKSLRRGARSALWVGAKHRLLPAACWLSAASMLPAACTPLADGGLWAARIAIGLQMSTLDS